MMRSSIHSTRSGHQGEARITPVQTPSLALASDCSIRFIEWRLSPEDFRRKCPIDGGKGRGSAASEECRDQSAKWRPMGGAQVRRAMMRGHSRSAGPGARPGIGLSQLPLGPVRPVCSGHAIAQALRMALARPVSFAYLGIGLIGRLDANPCSRRCARKVHHLFGRVRRFASASRSAFAALRSAAKPKPSVNWSRRR